MRCVNWNMHTSNTNREENLRRLIKDIQPQVVFLQEAQFLTDEEVPKHMRLVRPTVNGELPWERRGNPILVDKLLPIDYAWSIKLSDHGYTKSDGSKQPPFYATTVLIDNWLRGVSVHMPPSVNWKFGLPIGPPKRVAVYRQCSQTLVKIVNHRPRVPLVLSGDWNESIFTRGLWTPNWIARKATLNKRAMKGIDYPLYQNCELSSVGTLIKNYGSDHHPVVFNIRKDR